MNAQYSSIEFLLYFAVSCLLSNFLLRIVLKTSLVGVFSDKPDHRKVHSKPIPRVGGIAIILSFILISLCWLGLNHLSQSETGISTAAVWALFIAAGVIGIFGFFDDSIFFDVRVRHKISIELLLAVGTVYLFGIHPGPLSVLDLFVIPLWASQIISVFWILGLINAFNIIDGIDGLAGGISLIAIFTLALIAGIGGNFAMMSLCLILSGAIVGFLLFNKPPAKIFMGDTGSLFLGGMIAIISLHLAREVTGPRSVLIMPLIAGVPIVEVLVTIVRRYYKAKDRQKPFLYRIRSMGAADNSHMHHRFMFKGFDHFQSALILSITALTLCCGAVLLMFLPLYAVLPFTLYLAVPVILLLNRLGFGGRFKKALKISNSRYSGFKRPSVIGVIDKEGVLSHVLEKERRGDVVFFPITENVPQKISEHLHGAVIRSSAENHTNDLAKAELLAYNVKGPVFLVTAETNSKLAMLEIYKNGSLKKKERNKTLKELIREMQHISLQNKKKFYHGDTRTISTK
ncbi:Undecaprenyl-phosphate N-acetylglucosaminyl 1-phosphate transferase [Chitinispirillum alkaliphilum]|nr:Undecaprenyl-phosphate N-acetylglucosaminyl 1-phosphate transferase [Chitinispirillum alkaliphilum]